MVIRLSDREQAVLEALDTGLPVEKIAQQLLVSTNTVKTQMKSLYAKLGTHTRMHTLAKAKEHGLLRPWRPFPPVALRDQCQSASAGDWEGEVAGV